jgi:tRNA dimethylallyltransferase
MPVAAIVGPTAAGKSALSIDVALALDAEIVSVDSMQIYRGMDIGTDKATDEMRARVPHHLIDLKDPSEDVTVAEYQSIARSVIAEISERGRLPLLVGGSGLYLRAIVDDLRFPPRDTQVRQRLEQEVAAQGPEALHVRLTGLDPAAAAKIEPGNARRIVRALEVIELTEAPFSDNDTFGDYVSIYDLAIAGITRSRNDLYERVTGRVDRMLQSGLVQETHALVRHGLARTPSQALGYRQVITDEPNARDGIVRATKRFARRQESWFRADPRIEWFDASAEDISGAVISFLRARLSLDGDNN